MTIELLTQLEVLLSPVALALFGLCVGSFLNVVVHRLPLMLERQWWADVAQQLSDVDSWRRVFGNPRAKADPSPALQDTARSLTRGVEGLAPFSIARPRSRCPSCGHQLAWHENLPLIGWLRLKGRCSSCDTRISARYPIVELATAAMFFAVGMRFGVHATTLLWCSFAAILLALALIDWETTLLPDSLTLPLLWLGLVAAASGWTIPLATAVWGAVAGYLALWSVYWLFKLATGKEGMGHGDFKLLAALGAWLGWQMIVPMLLLASVIGALIGIGMKLAATLRQGRYIPFGPFLAGAGLVVMFAGAPTVLDWIGWA